jgi:hypothetical protein
VLYAALLFALADTAMKMAAGLVERTDPELAAQWRQILRR